MMNFIMSDVMTPLEAFELFPRKRRGLPGWFKAFFHRTPRAKVTFVRTAVAKY